MTTWPYFVVSGGAWRLQLIRAFDSRLVTDRAGAPSAPAARRAARARRTAVAASHAGGAGRPGAELPSLAGNRAVSGICPARGHAACQVGECAAGPPDIVREPLTVFGCAAVDRALVRRRTGRRRGFAG